MVNYILEYKWIILLVLEVLAWLATFFMLYARYQMQSALWFRLALKLTVATGVIPQVIMGLVNYSVTKEVDLFTLVIIMLILYGLTFGKKHAQKLDKGMQKKFSKSPNKQR